MMDCKSDSLPMDGGAGKARTLPTFFRDAALSVTGQRRFAFPDIDSTSPACLMPERCRDEPCANRSHRRGDRASRSPRAIASHPGTGFAFPSFAQARCTSPSAGACRCASAPELWHQASACTAVETFLMQHQGAPSVAGQRGFRESLLSIRGADDTLGEEAPSQRAAPYGPARSATRNGQPGGATS